MEKILAKTANIMETIWKEREGRLEIARAKQVSYWNNLEKEIQNLEMAVKPRSQDWQIQTETKNRKFEVDENEDIATNTEMARIVMELAEMSLEEENPLEQGVAEVCDRIDNMSLTGSAIGNINNNETANLCKKLKLMKISSTENNVLSTNGDKIHNLLSMGKISVSSRPVQWLIIIIIIYFQISKYNYCRLKNNSGHLVPWWVLNIFHDFTYSFSNFQ
jgi:hypothetical protein